MPIKTPEFEVGELYPDPNKVRYQGRVLKFDSPGDASKYFQKKAKKKMKWWPADRARAAEKELDKVLIDPGFGYKLAVVKDDSVFPPAVPKTPPKSLSMKKPLLKSLNSVLMKGAKEQALKVKEKKSKRLSIAKAKENKVPPLKSAGKKNKEDESDNDTVVLNEPEKEPEKNLLEDFAAIASSKEQSLIAAKVASSTRITPKFCFGCGSATCLDINKISVVVATANSMLDLTEVRKMTGDERVDWFLKLNEKTEPSGTGMRCASSYANASMRYETKDIPVSAKQSQASESQASYNYQRYLEDEQAAWDASSLDSEDDNVPLIQFGETSK